MKVRTTITITYTSDFDRLMDAQEFSGGAVDILRDEVAGWVGNENCTVHVNNVAEIASADAPGLAAARAQRAAGINR